MQQDRQKQENYKKVNLIAAKCMRFVTIILIISMVYCMYTSKADKIICISFFGACILLALIPSLLINVLKLDTAAATKVVVILCVSLIATILLTMLSVHVYGIILFPIIMATLYNNQTLTLLSALMMTGGVFISNLIAFKYKEYFIDYPATDLTDALFSYVIPQMLIVFALSIVSYFIVQRNSVIINSSINTSITMNDNQKGLIYSLSEISESKSKFTGEHIKRVAEYMRVLGHASGFDEDYVEMLATASMAHDIGKLMISEEILEKQSKLTDEEYQIMKSHVLYGEALLDKCPGEMMHIACILAKEHHEKWDGSGYLGMKGEEIAYISRLITVCDVFDALTTTRSYKKGWPVEEAYNEILKESGKSFDPAVVRLFIKNFDKIKEIHDRIPDKQIY